MKEAFRNATGVLQSNRRFATKQAFCNQTGVLQSNRRFAIKQAFCNRIGVLQPNRRFTTLVRFVSRTCTRCACTRHLLIHMPIEIISKLQCAHTLNMVGELHTRVNNLGTVVPSIACHLPDSYITFYQ